MANPWEDGRGQKRKVQLHVCYVLDVFLIDIKLFVFLGWLLNRGYFVANNFFLTLHRALLTPTRTL